MGPISSLGPTTAGGLPAVQLALGFNVIVQPNSAYVQPASQNCSCKASASTRSKGRCSSSTYVSKDGLWIALNPSDSCKKVFLDGNDNVLFGSRLGDHAAGAGGVDDLFGHARADTLKGGAGSDFISGSGTNRLSRLAPTLSSLMLMIFRGLSTKLWILSSKRCPVYKRLAAISDCCKK